MWFSNSLHPQMMTNEFHYIKFGIIQIDVETLSQTQIPNTHKQLSLTNTKPKVHKYQIPIAHKPKRESQINSKNCNAPNCETKTKRQQTSLTIPNCNPQISKNQTKESLLFSPPHSFLSLSNFLQQHYAYIGDLSWLVYPKPRRTKLLFHTQKENHSYSKRNSKSSS